MIIQKLNNLVECVYECTTSAVIIRCGVRSEKRTVDGVGQLMWSSDSWRGSHSSDGGWEMRMMMMMLTFILL